MQDYGFRKKCGLKHTTTELRVKQCDINLILYKGEVNKYIISQV